MVVYCNDGGSNTSPYETLAKAATAFLTAVDQLVAGEDLRIGMDHAENLAGSTVYTFPGTAAAPNRVISINTTTENYDKADNIQVDGAASGTFNVTMTGHYKLYGLSLKIGNDFKTDTTNLNALFDDCVIELDRSGANWEAGNSNGQATLTLKNTSVNFSGTTAASSGFTFATIKFFWNGGILLWSATMPTALFNVLDRDVFISCAGVDFLALSAATALVDVSDAADIIAEFRHSVKDPDLTLTTGTINSAGTQVLSKGVDDTVGNDLYNFEYVNYYGSIVHDDAIFVTTGGASDGVTPISWKMVTTANATEFSEPLISPPIPVWVNSTGSKTFTIQCVWDSASNMQNDEMWPEVEILESSTDTDSAFVSGGLADILATPADISDQTGVTWTGTGGFTNENKFALAVTATVNRVGLVFLRIHLAKPSTTAYADLKIAVT